MSDVQEIYRTRFTDTGLQKRDRVWRVLCKEFFDPLIGSGKDVLDLACGYGEFINNVTAKSRTAVDINPDAPRYLRDDVKFVLTPGTDLSAVTENSIDVAFTSNFLEHLPTKSDCDHVLREVYRVLRPGGRFIVLGPNIRYAYKEYWDFYDHFLPLSHVSLEEGLRINGYDIDKVVDRFLPYTMKSRLPSADILVKLYVKSRLLWPLFGKQFLVVARKPGI
ncbi:class I SAM-dependent methyltransferase [Microvirga sp. 2MCAF35]|uniref:class I SAM-dependent methyltransferase n=1 Tax=Microvirga sp. 2MCAF35 TaxID=3232987 RepID=UPI003F9A7DC4